MAIRQKGHVHCISYSKFWMLISVCPVADAGLGPCHWLERECDPNQGWREWVNQVLARLCQTLFSLKAVEISSTLNS